MHSPRAMSQEAFMLYFLMHAMAYVH